MQKQPVVVVRLLVQNSPEKEYREICKKQGGVGITILLYLPPLFFAYFQLFIALSVVAEARSPA